MWTVFVVAAFRTSSASPSRCCSTSSCRPAACALAGAAALGAAGRRRRDPLAVHVRPAARPDQFLPRRASGSPTRASPGSPTRRPRWPRRSSPRSGRAFPSRPSSIWPRCRTSTASRSRRRSSTAPARFARLIHVVIPAMREVIVINFVLTTILTFNYFDMIWVLTRGGPQNATHIFPTKIYELGFGQFRFGDAAAYGVFSILVLTLLITALFRRSSASRRRARTLRGHDDGALQPDSASSLAQVALALVILLPFFWMVSVSLKPADRALRDPGAALARPPDARELRHRLPAGVPHLFPQLDRRLAVDGGDHGDAGAARRLHASRASRHALILVCMAWSSRRRCFRRAPSSSRSTR